MFSQQVESDLLAKSREIYSRYGESAPAGTGIPSREMMSEMSVGLVTSENPVVSASQGRVHCEVTLSPSV